MGGGACERVTGDISRPECLCHVPAVCLRHAAAVLLVSGSHAQCSGQHLLHTCPIQVRPRPAQGNLGTVAHLQYLREGPRLRMRVDVTQPHAPKYRGRAQESQDRLDLRLRPGLEYSHLCGGV
eukprot:CAMPEP_0173252258 /NCGR_PEP_ID=MMETSP1142-20121109/20624_1 /TAXON_ID=483371 /ORGANISM="non described non described, Strain CCMP2298" /LENGTH=122 /DNA_ID=CAMNT_0014185275 /DNA_START=144 /DNA_END=512 /DNA_ORIENTATION=+